MESTCYEKTQQICETCSNACGKCKWSAFGKPVDGWVAVPTIIHISNQGVGSYVDSYRILRCPEYKPDPKRHTPKFSDDATMRLITHMLMQAVRDYARGCVKAQKHKLARPIDRVSLSTRRWLLSPIAEDMLYVSGIDADPSNLLKMIETDPHGVLERINLEQRADALISKKGKYEERKKYS